MPPQPMTPSTRAPARWIGSRGPGTLVTTPDDRSWLTRWIARSPGGVSSEVAASSVRDSHGAGDSRSSRIVAWIAASRRTGVGSPVGSITGSNPMRLPRSRGSGSSAGRRLTGTITSTSSAVAPWSCR